MLRQSVCVCVWSLRETQKPVHENIWKLFNASGAICTSTIIHSHCLSIQIVPFIAFVQVVVQFQFRSHCYLHNFPALSFFEQSSSEERWRTSMNMVILMKSEYMKYLICTIILEILQVINIHTRSNKSRNKRLMWECVWKEWNS